MGLNKETRVGKYFFFDNWKRKKKKHSELLEFKLNFHRFNFAHFCGGNLQDTTKKGIDNCFLFLYLVLFLNSNTYLILEIMICKNNVKEWIKYCLFSNT